MMRAKARSATTASAFAPMKEAKTANGVGGAAAVAAEDKWEVRPGGMLVQKRDPDSGVSAAAPVPTIRVKVKYAGACHEIYISSQASFGDLKKMLEARTNLHPDDQKLVFKDKERESKAFLDLCGVKDRSKIVLLEDLTAQAKRLLELRRTGKMERAAKSISRVSLDVDKLASKVSALETIVNKGGKVVEEDVNNLTELLMNELVKLDAITAEGDVKSQRRIQVKRVQRYVEALDAIKVKNATPRPNGHINKPAAGAATPAPPPPPLQSPQQRRQFQAPAQLRPVVVTTRWETFDLLSGAVPSTSSAATSTTATPASTTSSSSSSSSAASAAPTPRYNWELF